jgi:hypothetical protein
MRWKGSGKEEVCMLWSYWIALGPPIEALCFSCYWHGICICTGRGRGVDGLRDGVRISIGSSLGTISINC